MQPARGGASCSSHMLIPPKGCIALISDSSELARVEGVQEFSVLARQGLDVLHSILNGGVDVTSTRELLASGVRSLLQHAALLC